MNGIEENVILWNPIKKFGNPECSGLYLVTTKTSGCVAQEDMTLSKTVGRSVSLWHGLICQKHTERMKTNEHPIQSQNNELKKQNRMLERLIELLEKQSTFIN